MLTTIPAEAPVEEILGLLAEDGAVVVSNLIAGDVLASLQNDLVQATHKHHPGTLSDDLSMQQFWGSNTKRFGRLLLRSPSFVNVLANPVMEAVSDTLLLPNAKDWWLNSAQMMAIGPGETAQFIHRDVNNWPHFLQPQAPDVTVSWMLALGPFTKSNGATNLVLGSHLDADYTTCVERQIIQAEMETGSGLLYSGKTLHGGGANTTNNEWRLGLHVSHVVGWLTPEEALPLSNPWEYVKDLHPVLQRRLGWRCYEGDEVEVGRLWTVNYEDIPLGLGL
jgi:ectoine hydroxylase-related dioxygenase (phytanoyl-CoA dioxygenase family)